MSRPSQTKRYLPSVPSPLNPTITCPDCSHTTTTPTTKKHQARRVSPSLSYAQHILRAKAAEAWRSEALRRAYQDLDERDISDSPLSRAALDMRRDVAPPSAEVEAQPAVDLEGSLGLDGIGAPNMEEKVGFGFLQPFTVDLSHATSQHARAVDGEEERGPRRVTRRVLLVVGLLCLSYCLLPGMRYRATFRQGLVTS